MDQAGSEGAATRGTPGVARLRLAAVVILGLGCGTQASAGPLGPALAAALVLALFAACEGLLRRPRALPRPLPVPLLVFFGCILASWAAPGLPRAGCRDVVQVVLYLGVTLLVAARFSSRDRCVFRAGLVVAFALNIVIASWQLLAPGAAAGLLALLYGAPWVVGGTGPTLAEEITTGLFPSHLLYAAFLALSFPFVLVTLRRWGPRVFWAVGALTCLAAAQTVYHAGYIALLGIGGLLTVLRAPEPWRPKPAWVAPLAIAVLLAAGSQHWLGPAEPPSAWSFLQPFTDAAGQERAPKRLTIETAAALESIPRHPLGWGPGTYRESIHKARIECGLPRPTQNRVRRDSNSQYAVTAVESGLAAALCLLALIIGAFCRELVRPAAVDEPAGVHAPATAAALAVLAGVGLFSVFLVRGLGPLAAVLLGSGWRERAAGDVALPARATARKLAAQALFLGLATALPLGIGRPAPPPVPEEDSSNAPAGVTFFLEAEDCERHHENFIVHLANDAGANRVISIPLGSGKGVGEIVYKLNVPAAGTYKLWLRVYWEGGCANSVLCQLGSEREVTIADSIFKRWHWVDVGPGHRFDLPAGETEFRLKNAEDGVHIDQIAFLADPHAVPTGILRRTEPSAAGPERAQAGTDRRGGNGEEDDGDGDEDVPLSVFDDEDAPTEQEFDKYGE